MQAIVRSQMESTVLHILKNETINLTTRPPSSTNILILSEMKAKLLEILTNKPECIQNKLDLDVYNALLDVVARDERIAKKDTYKKDSFRKCSHNDQDPYNREGEKKKKQKVIGRSSSGKGPTITKPANDIPPSTTDQPQDYEMNSKDIGSDWIDEDSPKEYEWFEMMVNPHKDPKDDETPQEGSTIAFAKHLKYNIKVDKLTKDELKGSREKDSIL
ncbi:hypothetical protein Tco_1468970 [Tanacetum coccineum]